MPPLAQLRLRLALHRDADPSEPRILSWTAQARHALALLEEQLAGAGPSGWLVTADHPSIADVALYPYTRFAPMGGISLDVYPAASAWLDRFQRLPGYQPLFPGQPDMDFATSDAERPA